MEFLRKCDSSFKNYETRNETFIFQERGFITFILPTSTYKVSLTLESLNHQRISRETFLHVYFRVKKYEYWLDFY